MSKVPFGLTIGGKILHASATSEVVDPATGELYALAPSASEAELELAVDSAALAFKSWRQASLEQRQKAVSLLGDCLTDNTDELAQILSSEQGKPLEAARSEIFWSAHWCHEIAKQSLPDEIVEDGPDRRVITRRAPLGVVAAITPWNFPVLISIWKVAPALLAGNTVILKPAPSTPLACLRLGELMLDKLPPGVLNVLAGGNDLGAAISAHPRIAKIAFTGSTLTGRKIMKSASDTLKRLTLELGGNDAGIVLEDAQVEQVAESIFWSAFSNSGQYCGAAKRLYVHDRVYDRTMAALVDYAKVVKMGPGSEPDVKLGPIQNATQFGKVKTLIDRAHADGLKIVTGGVVSQGPGYFVPVTIIDNPPEDHPVVTEEAFGPVLPLLRFTDDADLVARANEGIYGLSATIWTNDTTRAEALAEALDVGVVWINEVQGYSPDWIFAGHKQSGIGGENGIEGLKHYTNPQTVITRRPGSN